MQEMRVAQMCAHPRWNGNVQDGFDIALARLPRPVRNPICPGLADGSDRFRYNIVVSALGWGLHDHHSDGVVKMKASNVLRVAEKLIIWDHEHCPGKAKSILKEHMLCAHSNQQSTCKGEQSSKKTVFFLSIGVLNNPFSHILCYGSQNFWVL